MTGSFSLWHAVWRFGLDVVGGIAIGVGVGLRDPPGASPHQPLADLDRDRAAVGLLRLPAGAGGRRLGRARRRHRGRLRGLVHARADDRADAPAGRCRLGDPDLPAQRPAVRPRRSPAATDPRLAAGALDRFADRRGRGREPGGDGHAHDLDLPATYLPRRMWKRIRERDPYPPWQHPALLGWAGLRGAVSLAAALALPLTIDSGEAFPHALLHDLPRVLRDPRHARPAGAHAPGRDPHAAAGGRRPVGKEETKARILAAEAALGRLEELAGEDWVREDTAERMRGAYRFRAAASPPASTTRTTARSRSGRRATSACGASCSTPSAARCRSCAARAASTTTS